MHADCVRLRKIMSWLDTVDVEHVVLEIFNECREDLEILRISVMGEPSGELLYDRSNILVSGGRGYQFEVLLEKFFERLIVELEFKEEKTRVVVPIR